MKFLKNLSLVLLVTVLLVGCSKDDDKGTTATLLGTWKLTSSTLNGVPEVLDVCELKSTVKFTETSVIIKNYDGENCEELFEIEGGYIRNGNSLTLTYLGEPIMEGEILELSVTTLKIKEQDEDGEMVTTLTRQ